MTTGTFFLGGAVNRLLPASIPFRFFAAAVGFHVVAWLVLFFAADELPGFAGGTGPVLAAIHLLTLGVLAMTAIGASYQLLPVATRRPLARIWPAIASFWLVGPGIPVLAYGMAGPVPLALHAGAGLVGAGLAVFALLTADNLRRAGSLPIVAAHGWGALVALVGLGAAGIALIVDFDAGFLPDHQGMAAVHMVLATFGFMGLLVLGFSQVLVPMFVLSRALPARPGWVQLALAVLGILLFAIGRLRNIPFIEELAWAFALGAVASYLWLMRAAFRTRMRKRLGLSFVMIRSSWALLVLGMAIGVAVTLGAPIPNGPTLFGFVVLAGWLLTFLTGILQRIMPFLASMHASGMPGKPPLLSDLTAEGPLKIHAICHFVALALCAGGIVLDAPLLVQLGAAAGLAGALAFAGFAAFVVIRLRSPAPDA